MMPCKIEKNIGTGNHYKQACNFFIIQSNKKVLILNHFMLYTDEHFYIVIQMLQETFCVPQRIFLLMPSRQ